LERAKEKCKGVDAPDLAAAALGIEGVDITGATYLQTEAGKPFSSVNSFGNWFRKACRTAQLPECSSHGLRKIAATCCAEAGATPHELMAMFGWSDIKMALLYTRAAEQKKLAAMAAERLGNAAIERLRNKAVTPFVIPAKHSR
jgi:integrase